MPRAKKQPDGKGTVEDVQVATADGTLAYRVVWHVKHGGHRFQPGDTINLDAQTAAGLLKAGAIATNER